MALALLLVLVGSVFAFGMNLAASRDRLNRHMRQAQAVRVFLDRLEQDLRTSVAADARHGAGIVGDGASIALLSRSIGLMGQSGATASPLGDLQYSEYRWRDGGAVLEASRGAPGAAPVWHTIADDLGFVQWRYHDGNGWSGSFDSAAQRRLPVAIEVAIWFHPPPRDESERAPPEPNDRSAGDPFGNPLGALERPPAEERDEPDELADESRRDWPPPDRVRVILVPDAPEFEYGRRYEDDADLPVSTNGDLDEGNQP